MNKAALKRHSGKVESKPTPALNVLVMYEDRVTSLRAKHSIGRLLQRLNMEAAGLKTKLWRVDLLDKPLLRELAAVEAVAADVIILSFHGTRDLSFEVREWLNRWLDRKQDRPYALGILLDPQVLCQGKNHPVAACLEQIAAESGADVFYGAAEASPAAWDDSSRNEIDERACYISEVIKSILRHSEPHQGEGSNE